MNPPVRIGFVGCGRAAERLHLPAIGPATGTRLTAAYDPLRSRRELIASGHPGCHMFESAESLVASGEVDAVVIATPAETHVAMASLALRAGLPVLVEKPLAASVSEANRLASVQEDTGVPVMVGLNRRHWEPAARLQGRLNERREGPAFVTMEISSNLAAWSALAASSDPLDDLGTHQLDLLRFLFGSEISTVQATQPSPAEFHLNIRLEDGTAATCVAAYRNRSEERIQVSVGQDRNSIHVGSERIRPHGGPMRRALDFADSARRRVLRGRGSLSNSYYRQLSSFVACVRSREPASPSLHDGLAVLRGIEAARASLAARGATVSVNPIS